MGWRDTIQPDRSVTTDSAPKSSWRDTIQDDPDASPSHSSVTAITTQLIEGSTPFASALAGAGKAGMDAITGVRGPLAGEDLGSIADDYRQARDSFSNDAKSAAAANPKLAIASNLVGGGANPLFRAAKGLAGMAGAGAVQGLGQSDADLTKGEIKPALEDAALGAGGAAAGYGVGKAVGYGLGKAIPYASKKLLTTLGPSEEAIDARLAGKAQPTAPNYPEIAEDMGEGLKNLKGQISDKVGDAWEKLSPDESISPAVINDAIDTSIAGMKVKNGQTIGPASKNTVNVLNSIKDDIRGLSAPKKLSAPVAEAPIYNSAESAFSDLANPKEAPSVPTPPTQDLSEGDLKSIIKKLDENINWDDQSQNTQNTALEGVRKKIDSVLKFQNPQYKDAMVPVSDRMAVLDKIRRQFNFKNEPGSGLVPTDTTATKIQTSLRDNKAITQDNLNDFGDLVGKNYGDMAKDYQLSQQFENTGPNGARRTALGGVVGSYLGHLFPSVGIPAGAAMGGAAGAVLDRYGGKAVGKMIDTYLAAGNSKAFGKFAPVIQKAAQSGPTALAVTSSILAKNPEFRKLVGLDNSPQ